MSIKSVRIFFFSIMLIPGIGLGQTTISGSSLQDTSNVVQILQADKFRRVKQDSSGDLNILVGRVLLRQKTTLFYCDSAIQNILLNQLEAFGNIHINDNDSVHTYSQYLKYLGNTKFAELKKKVKLTDGKGVLTTEALEYDVNANIGTYKTGGKVVNGESVLTSKEGIYYANTRDVYFQNNVKLVDPEYTLSTDTLLYNVNSELARFVSPTKIFDGKSSIETRSGFYDLKQGLADFNKRPVIRDSSQTVVADSIVYNKNSGAGMAIGYVNYSDTSQGISMVAGKAEFNNTTKVIKTYQRPLMKLLQEGDSLFVAADTLYSAYLGFDSSGITNPADTFRFFRAYHHVKIFSDSLQGKCDSLYYSSMDSVFRFFKDPVMWAQESQISGDTIYLFTRNKKADKILVNENAFSVNKSAEGLYNQLKGNTMSGQFINGEIDFLRTKGNSESLYYLQEEDSSYMGMNYSQADAIVMKFIGKEIKRVSWINGVSGTTYPMKQIPSDKKELRNFKWLDAIRPKNIGDLLSIQ